MAREDKKTLLIVEDDKCILEGYEIAFGGKYNVVSCFYERGKTSIPQERVDGAIVDGLYGECINVMKKINADKNKIVLVSGDNYILEEARKNGWIAEMKPINFHKLEEILG